MTTMAEPEWDQQTRDLVLAYDALEVCPVCHGLLAECTDASLQEQWRAGDPVRCHRETARLARQQHVTEETNPQSGALMWPVELKGA